MRSISAERRAVFALRETGRVPFALIGAVGGLALYRRMTNRQFQVAVSAALVVSGVGLAARSEPRCAGRLVR
jgi:hypothetical protein